MAEHGRARFVTRKIPAVNIQFPQQLSKLGAVKFLPIGIYYALIDSLNCLNGSLPFLRLSEASLIPLVYTPRQKNPTELLLMAKGKAESSSSQNPPLYPKWLESSRLSDVEKKFLRRIIDGSGNRTSLVSVLDECEFTPREIHDWLKQVDTKSSIATRPDIIYPRMITGLSAISQSHLPRNLKYRLLMGIVDAGNPYLSAYEELGPALKACEYSHLPPEKQVDFLIALARSQETRVIQTYRELEEILPRVRKVFKSLGLSNDQIGDRLILLANIREPFTETTRILIDAVSEFRSRGWNHCCTDRTLVLFMERIEDFSEWISGYLKSTLDVLQSEGRTPDDQYHLLEAFSTIGAPAEVSLSDQADGICSLSRFGFDPKLLSEGLVLMRKLSTELQPEDLVRKEEAESRTDINFAKILIEARHTLADMIICPQGKSPDELMLDLIYRSRESLWAALALIKALHQEGMLLRTAHAFVVLLLARAPENIRLFVIKKLMANHTPAIVADPQSYYEVFKGLGEELMRFLDRPPSPSKIRQLPEI